MEVNAKQLLYRIGPSDRNIGGSCAVPDNFVVYNTTNGKIFVALSGVWTDGGTIASNTLPFNLSQFLVDWRQS